MIRRPAALVALAAGLGAEAPPLPFVGASVPGGVAVVPLPPSTQAPKAAFRGEPVLVRRAGHGWAALVGLPLSQEPGEAKLDVDGRTVAFTVKPKRYPEQRVTIKNPRLVTPDPEDEARIAEEAKRIGPAWKQRPGGWEAPLRLAQPTPGSLTSSFGMRRVFNGQPRSPHSGLDIRAPQGQPVRAPAAGVVVLTGNFFFSGNAVFLAHGEGLVSLLCHLSAISVTEGQTVKAGEVIGKVGATGRASGPHLHWSLSLNDARVDPRLFLAVGKR